MTFSNFRLETDRLILNALNDHYDKDVFTCFTPDITTYMYPYPPENIDGTRAFISESVKNMKNGIEVVVAIIEKKSGDFIGCSGIHKIQSTTPELGIWLAKKAHGNGYGLETITALVEWARKNLIFEYLIYPVDKRNNPSIRIPVALGGIAGKEYQTEGMAGNKLDVVEYTISKE